MAETTESLALSGPEPGRHVRTPFGADVSSVGYTDEEWFVTGTARSYETDLPRPLNGQWQGRPGPSSAFATRVLVRRPVDASRFNGTVLVEWLNVSGGLDTDPDWGYMHRHITRAGFAWVGVSAQKVGVEGGGGFFAGLGLNELDPDRYARLDHPGDAFSYDIFTQVGRAVVGGDLLAPLVPERVLAIGESQSAAFLVTYINGIDSSAAVFDGYLVHGRGVAGAGLAGYGIPIGASDEEVEAARREADRHPEIVRADTRTPVLILQSETDVMALGSLASRQPDSDRIRLWEIAGAAHADTYSMTAGLRDSGQLSPAELAILLRPTHEVYGITLAEPVNSGPQHHYVSHAALAALDRWVRGGSPPGSAARLEVTQDGKSFVVDEHGNAGGGVRTPWVDVPIATLSGQPQPSNDKFAFLLGSTAPFGEAKRASLYPAGVSSYLPRFERSLRDCVEAGFLLDADAPEIEAVAAAAFDLQGS